MILSPIPSQTPKLLRHAESAPLESEPRNFDAILKRSQTTPDSKNEHVPRSELNRDAKSSERAESNRSDAPRSSEVRNKSPRHGKAGVSDQVERESAESANPNVQDQAAELSQGETPSKTQTQTSDTTSDDVATSEEKSQSSESTAVQASLEADKALPVPSSAVHQATALYTSPQLPAANALDVDATAEGETSSSTETSTSESDSTAKAVRSTDSKSAIDTALNELFQSHAAKVANAENFSDSATSQPPSSSPGSPAAAVTTHPQNHTSRDPAAAAPPQNFAAQLAEQMDTQANVAQVTRGLQAALHQNGGSITLRLNPPELGLVRVQMQLDAGVVRAELVAQQDSAASLLSRELGQLKQALESQGLTVDKLGVQTMSPSAPLSASRDANGFSNNAQDDGRSRGQMHEERRERTPQPAWNPADELSDFDRKLLNLVA